MTSSELSELWIFVVFYFQTKKGLTLCPPYKKLLMTRGEAAAAAAKTFRVPTYNHTRTFGIMSAST